MNYSDLPVGFAMELAQNDAALQNFGAMDAFQKQHFVDRAHSALSRAEMHQIVAEIGNTTYS